MFRNFILLLGAGFLGACGGPSRSTVGERQAQDTAYLQYEAMIRDFLVGKRLSSLAKIMAPDDVPPAHCVLLIYHGMDCGSCLDAGFASLGRLRNERVPCVVVAIDANVSEVQQRYGYYDYIYTDRGDWLRRELKYVNTPILLLLDDSLQIVDMYKPASGTEVAATRFEQTARALRAAGR